MIHLWHQKPLFGNFIFKRVCFHSTYNYHDMKIFIQQILTNITTQPSIKSSFGKGQILVNAG